MSSFKTLIDAETLERALGRSDWAVVDCRFMLDDVDWGARQFEEAHVPGAVYVHLDRDLSGTKTGTNGRHPLPDPKILADRFGQLGIGPGTQVVAYDQDAGSWASRLWWLLRWLGHDAVAVLDGGFAAWRAAGRPVQSGCTVRQPATFVANEQREMIVDVSQVEALHTQNDWCLVDARAPERFRGEIEPLDRVPGHIPGAINRFYKNNLGPTGLFLPADTLTSQWRDTLGTTSPDHVVCYCGSGVTACHNLLALEHAELSGAKLYVGSWSEWSSVPARPVARGDE